MMGLEQAWAAIRTEVLPAPVASLPLSECRNLFLAQPLISPRPLPACDNSAMDGYALKASETRGASRDRPAQFRVTGSSIAGTECKLHIRAGEAVRIFTGAPIPAGADCVVRQEATGQQQETLDVFLEVPSGKNIRLQGEELASGTAFVGAGRRINAHVLGLAASFRFAVLEVRPRPRLGILTLGDELVEPGTPAAAHQVHDSNSVLLTAMAEEAGGVVTCTQRCSDDSSAVLSALSRLSPAADILVTCGGASVGDRDQVKAALVTAGASLRVDRVAIKPGTPAGFTVLNGRPVFILPGNPGAATVVFDQLVRPAIFRWQGVSERRRTQRVQLDRPWNKQPNLTAFLSARWDPEAPSKAQVRPQGAGQMLQNIEASGWVRLGSGKQDFEQGEWVDLELFGNPRFEVEA